MTPETITTFLRGYIHSLAEETRDQKGGAKYGFDQIIDQIALSEGWKLLRGAAHPGGRAANPRPKKEAEHGEDSKWISANGRKLIVFVLKDEPLTYRNWESAKFHSDLSRACNQDITTPEMFRVKDVHVILAYNKDEDANGLMEFERFVKSRNPKIAGRAKLHVERWNLTTLTARVQAKLIESPSLLPEVFFKPFSYICWQTADFSHGTDQWRDVLLPDWREFLTLILSPPVTERGVRMLSVALIVLKAHGKKEAAFETGWIELVEWAVLALWKAVNTTRKLGVWHAAYAIWEESYISEVAKYYSRHERLFAAEHSLSSECSGEFGEAVSVYHCYWHLGRLGILARACCDFRSALPKDKLPVVELLFRRACKWMVAIINGNPACFRPLLDIHHIELFLVWYTLEFAGHSKDAFVVFSQLRDRLVLRRLGECGIRLIDQSNSWPRLFEFVATKEPASEAYGRSSYLLQMIIEICVLGLGPDGESLAANIYQHLIAGNSDAGEPWNFPERVELQSWVPPEDWGEKILSGPVRHEGISVSIHGLDCEKGEEAFGVRVRNFVEQSRQVHPFNAPYGIPSSVLILACILHKSPLPPEFWRAGFFPPITNKVKARKKSTSKKISTPKGKRKS